jgi:hypothetical protein
LYDLTTQHASSEAPWQKGKRKLTKREVRREYTIVYKSQELHSLQSKFSTLKRENETVRVIPSKEITW